MIVYQITFACAAITSFVLGFLVLSHNYRSQVNRSWFYLSIAVCVYSTFFCFHVSANSEKVATYYAKILHAGSILTTPCFLLFSVNLTKLYKRYKKVVFGSFLAALFFLAQLFGNSLIKGSEPFSVYKFFVVTGPVYSVYMVFFNMNILISGYVLFSSLFKEKNKQNRLRLKYVISAGLIGFLSGGATILTAYRVPNVEYYSVLFPIYPIIISHSIMKHHLMDIEVVVKKTIVFAGISAVVLITIVSASMFMQDVIGIWFGLSRSASFVLIALIITAVYDPIKRMLIHLTENVLFQKKYEYKGILKVFLEDVLRIRDLGQIVRGTKDLINSTLHPSKCLICLGDTTKDKYVEYDNGENIFIEPNSELVDHLNDKHDLINIEFGNHPDRVVREMKQLGVVIAIPLESRNQLLGIMLLGKKRSDDDYSPDDLDVLRDLSKAEAIAIDNAKAGIEVIKNKTAEQMAHLADGMSHQYNNYFGCMVSELDMKEIFVPESLKECESLNLEEQNAKLKEIVNEMLESIAIVNADAKRGGELAESVLNHTRADKVGFKIQNIAKGVDLGIRFVGLRRRDLHTININKNIPDDLPPTWSNMSSLQNMFQITIDNAYDSIQKKIESDPGYKGVIDITLIHKKIENLIRIVIKDNGIGMKPRELEAVRAHVPYFTTKGSSSGKSGFGAGISFLAELVRLHDGRLDYESTYGEGASCVIDLPVTDKPPGRVTVK